MFSSVLSPVAHYKKTTHCTEKCTWDIADLRVVRLDMTNLYTFVPQMEAWRAELTQHARQALEQPDAAITPITLLASTMN